MVPQAVQYDETRGKWVAIVNGKIVARSQHSREYVQTKLDSYLSMIGEKVVPISLVPNQTQHAVTTDAVSLKFSVQERFEFIHDYVGLVAKDKINSFILTGTGGIGKTTAVTEALQNLDMHEDVPNQPSGDYLVQKGYTTAKGLYNSLFNTNDRILVLDDCDDAFRNETAISILKAALDDKKERVLTWSSQSYGSDEDEIPKRFPYTGRVIFVSNRSLKDFPQALISRSQKVDLTLNMHEMIERIEWVFDRINADTDVKEDVLTFVKKYAHMATDLNVRTATSLITLREEFGSTWERKALYSFTS